MACPPKIDEMIEDKKDWEGDLTCGVELEFLVPSLDDTRKLDPDRLEITDQHLIRSSCREQHYISLSVRDQLLNTLVTQLPDIPFRHMDDDECYPPHDNVVIYNAWRLGQDNSIMKNYNPNVIVTGPYDWTGCEITSPVLSDYKYASKIEDVCKVLKTIRIHLNHSTSVHVHVGRGDQPFSLLTLKKFASLYWLTEDAVLEIHHPSRRSNAHCFRLNRYSRLATKSQETLNREEEGLHKESLEAMKNIIPGAGLSTLKRSQICRIWGCWNMEELALLMGGDPAWEDKTRIAGERGSVGFQRFIQCGKTGGNTQTFEWRQMAGSLGARHINEWIKFCLAFTNFCRKSFDLEFKRFMDKVIQRGMDYAGIELLEAMNVDVQVFRDVMEVWSTNPGFCEANSGKKLFVPQ
jgi:hypothetical protein